MARFSGEMKRLPPARARGMDVLFGVINQQDVSRGQA
jgi:hypothetical protein